MSVSNMSRFYDYRAPLGAQLCVGTPANRGCYRVGGAKRGEGAALVCCGGAGMLKVVQQLEKSEPVFKIKQLVFLFLMFY